ncbi:hypothetical protein CDCA_CDCA18G4503 [Cyanidium caldarium]|uniref:Elongator complex protein 5 n=1 Tax=Cyanidium caldarium TaxID=2771 RepID=A0AAV9J298_CYACA|nr:hypothetical protein CDCA_CDCA18G4503 [Cyanidium caldarium]
MHSGKTSIEFPLVNALLRRGSTTLLTSDWREETTALARAFLTEVLVRHELQSTPSARPVALVSSDEPLHWWLPPWLHKRLQSGDGARQESSVVRALQADHSLIVLVSLSAALHAERAPAEPTSLLHSWILGHVPSPHTSSTVVAVFRPAEHSRLVADAVLAAGTARVDFPPDGGCVCTVHPASAHHPIMRAFDVAWRVDGASSAPQLHFSERPYAPAATAPPSTDPSVEHLATELPFSITLTERQNRAREQVRLPYEHRDATLADAALRTPEGFLVLDNVEADEPGSDPEVSSDEDLDV